MLTEDEQFHGDGDFPVLIAHRALVVAVVVQLGAYDLQFGALVAEEVVSHLRVRHSPAVRQQVVPEQKTGRGFEVRDTHISSMDDSQIT